MAERTGRSMERAGRYRLPGAWTGVLGLALLGVGLALAAPSLAEEGNASPAKSELTREDITRAMNNDQKQRPKADWTWEEITKAAGKGQTEAEIKELEKSDPSSDNYVPVWERRKPVTPSWEKD